MFQTSVHLERPLLDSGRNSERLDTRDTTRARTEVTQGQYFALIGYRPVATRRDFVDGECAAAGVGDNLPVVCVDWLEAVTFCNRLSVIEGLDPVCEISGSDVSWGEGDGYRLPTEAEWEYAARGDVRTSYVGTSTESEICSYANVAAQATLERTPDFAVFDCDDGFPVLAPVDHERFPDNPWRLRGLGGNASEWVWDA